MAQEYRIVSFYVNIFMKNGRIFYMKLTLPSAAIGVIFNEDKSQVLLVKRKDVPVWVLPGGGINPNESPKTAALREIKEETGLVVRIVRQSGYYLPVNRLAAPTSVFVCQIIDGRCGLSDETAGCAFYPINQLPASLFILHKDWLNDALQFPFLVEKPINQVTYWRVILYLFSHPYLLIRYSLTRLINLFKGE